MNRRFTDRTDAGRALADRLAALDLPRPWVVLALPRGGVPVAAEVALRLGAPLDLLLVRKIGTPWQPELALAAVVEGHPPDLVIDDALQALAREEPRHIEREMAAALREIERQRTLYLAGRPAAPVAGRTVILVDDGVATGTTVRAALLALRRRRPARLVLAVPVAPPESLARLRAEVDDLVCLDSPSAFAAVGSSYLDFHQVSDDEVLAALARCSPPMPE